MKMSELAEYKENKEGFFNQYYWTAEMMKLNLTRINICFCNSHIESKLLFHKKHLVEDGKYYH